MLVKVRVFFITSIFVFHFFSAVCAVRWRDDGIHLVAALLYVPFDALYFVSSPKDINVFFSLYITCVSFYWNDLLKRSNSVVIINSFSFTLF